MTGAPIPHPDPELARRGVLLKDSATTGTVRRIAPRPNTSGWIAGATALRAEHAYMRRVDVPAGLSIPVGQAAWFGLRRVTPQSIGQEFALVHAVGSLLPCDSTNGSGVANAIAWGDSKGMTAAIVIGRDLPIQLGAWSAAPVDVAGLADSDAAPPPRTLVSSASRPNPYFAVLRFATGTYADNPPFRTTQQRPFSGNAARFVQTESLDVALVLDRAYVDGLAAPGVVVGHAEVAMTLGVRVPGSPFTA